MEKKDIHFSIEVYDSDKELTETDAGLLLAARETTALAYAPYSNFLVGAVALLANGKKVTGTNQENASYPVGICAERVLLSAASSLYPNVPIDSIAISYNNLNGDSGHPVTPCGICRQSLAEYEERVKQPMRLIMSGKKGAVHILEKASQLLPLSFTPEDLK
ncbi:MAG: cytidine deaminase [Ferruginibacter sp.]